MVSNSAPAAQAQTPALTILIADDKPYILLVLEEIFKRSGFKVVTCEDGKEAVRKTNIENPNVIILDGLMPCMSGPEAALEILKTHAIPIIIYSSCLEIEEKTPAGCLFVFKSPDSITRLVEEVGNLTALTGGTNDYERRSTQKETVDRG